MAARSLEVQESFEVATAILDQQGSNIETTGHDEEHDAWRQKKGGYVGQGVPKNYLGNNWIQT